MLYSVEKHEANVKFTWNFTQLADMVLAYSNYRAFAKYSSINALARHSRLKFQCHAPSRACHQTPH